MAPSTPYDLPFPSSSSSHCSLENYTPALSSTARLRRGKATARSRMQNQFTIESYMSLQLGLSRIAPATLVR
jgi:hypothetical protein